MTNTEEFGHYRKPLGNLTWRRIWRWQMSRYTRDGWNVMVGGEPVTWLRPVAWQYEVSIDHMRVVADRKLTVPALEPLPSIDESIDACAVSYVDRSERLARAWQA